MHRTVSKIGKKHLLVYGYGSIKSAFIDPRMVRMNIFSSRGMCVRYFTHHNNLCDSKEDNNTKDTKDKSKTTSTYSEYFRDIYSEYGKDAKQFRSDISQALEQLEKKSYNMRKLKYIAGCVSIIILFMFWRTIKSFVSRETSDVAVRTMNDDNFKKQVYTTLIKIIEDARNDPEIATMLADLMSKALVIVINDERTDKLLHDEGFLKILSSVASNVTSDVLKSEQTKKDLDELVAKEVETQLKDKQNKAMLADTFYDAACAALSRFKPW
jgi:hypothetical protein